MMKNVDYIRLSYLGDKVKKGTASKEEKDEFMGLLHMNGSITSIQYNDYISNRNAENIINAGLAIGAVVLIGYLLKELFKA
jgi:hypothetical protein